MGQLVECLLPTPEVRGLNPVIGIIYIEHLLVNCIEKTKIDKKETGKCPFDFLQVLLLSTLPKTPATASDHFE